MQKAILAKSNWQVYLTFHSYGNFWFTPWGYTFKLPHDYHDLALKAQKAVDALKNVNGNLPNKQFISKIYFFPIRLSILGSIFTVGSSANLLCKLKKDNLR